MDPSQALVRCSCGPTADFRFRGTYIRVYIYAYIYIYIISQLQILGFGVSGFRVQGFVVWVWGLSFGYTCLLGNSAQFLCEASLV